MALAGLALTGGAALALESLTFRFPGADEELSDALRAASALQAAQAEGLTDAQDIFAAARAEYGRLIGVLYAEGRYSAVITVTIDGREAATIPPLDAPASIGDVVVTVTPGQVFRFSRAEIAPLAGGTVLPRDFRLGGVAETGVMADAVGAAVDRWRDLGHAKAEPTQEQITADHLTTEVDARFGLNPGPVVRFGDLTISGNRDVRTRRIATIAGLPLGEIYSPQEIADATRRLRRTGTFSSVTLTEAETLGPGNTMDIDLTVVEQTPRRIGFGAEIATVDGLTLSGFWLHRNLLGGAETLRLDGEISEIGAGDGGGTDYSFSARYTRPATVTPDTDLFALFTLERVDDRDYRADRFNFAVGLSHVFSDSLTGELALAIGREEVTDDIGTYEISTFSAPASLTWDRRDVVLNPKDGFYIDLDATPFVGLDDSSGSGGRLAVDARVYQAFGARERVVLAGRVQAGAVLGSEIFETPTDYLFYSGGGGTVRGQPYQSLGVDSACVTRGAAPDCVVRTGGLSFLGLSGEVRADVGRSFGVVGFADAGYISAGTFEDGDWHAGAGIGLRYNTGIGPIRLDIAAPVGGDTGEGVQVYVGIGQSF